MAKDERLAIRMNSALRDCIARDAQKQGDIPEAKVARRILTQYYEKQVARIKHLTKRGGA